MSKHPPGCPWDGIAGDLFRRGYSFGLSAIQLMIIARAVACERRDPDLEKSVLNGAHSPAVWTLTGFAFELLLKAAITAKTGDKVAHLGHDLVAALDKAEECGIHIQASTRFSIKIANQAHNNRGENKFFFRYGGGETASVETSDAVINSLYDLLEQVAPLVNNPDASFDSFLVHLAR